MKKDQDRSVIESKKAQAERARFEVRESTKGSLVVSEFERAPLTDVNFGF
jgi:hypothetical protein